MYDEDGTSIGTSVTLNARGEPSVSGNTTIIWLDSDISYKFVLANAVNTVEWTADNLSSGITTTLINSEIAAASNWPDITVNVTDSEHDVDFSAGSIADSTYAEVMDLGAMTKRLDASWAAGSASGGLFTGNVANSTTYYLFVISTASGVVDCGFDTSTTAANKPSGYTLYRKIGELVTDGSANISHITNTLKADIANRGANNGTCELDENGRIPFDRNTGLLARGKIVGTAVSAGSVNVDSAGTLGDFAIVTLSVTPDYPATAYAIVNGYNYAGGTPEPILSYMYPTGGGGNDAKFTITAWNNAGTQLTATDHLFTFEIFDGAA